MPSCICWAATIRRSNREAGFRSGEDLLAARSAGVTDPEKWREIMRERSAVERAAAAKERQQQKAREKAEAEARAHPRHVAYDKATDAAHIMMMSNAMDAIRQRLRDPQSAEFRNVHLATGSTGVTVTCGEVNAKNGFGGYSGFVGFISNGGALSSLASDFKNGKEFLKSWKQLCQ